MREIGEKLREAVHVQRFAGAVVAITDRHRTLWTEAFGDVTLDTIFHIASSSKPLAATTIFLLGSLDANARHLLSHSAGIFGNDTKDPVERDLLRNSHRALAEAAAGVIERPLIYPPGEGVAYSDAGIMLAGRSAEVAAGAEFDAIMRTLLLDPLGMRDTCYRCDRDLSTRLAVSHHRVGNKVQRAVLQHRVPKDGLIRVGGGLFSTAADLAAFLRFHLANAGRFGEMYVDQTGGRWHKDPMGGSNAGYGLGWQLGGGAIFHAGAFGSLIWAHQELGLGLVLLAQMPIMQIYGFWRELVSLFLAANQHPATP